MKRLFVSLLLCVAAAGNAQTISINSGTSGLTAPTGSLTTHQMGDDGHVHVPLQFGFPFYGKTFTNSVMYDNGVVGFFSPVTPTTQAIGCDPAVTYCGGSNWSSQQFNTNLGPSWNYMIAPLHTDLAPTTGSVYSTQGDATQMTYKWTNLGEFYNPSNLNTFSLQIKPSGFIGIDYEKVNIGQSNVSVGVTGDLAKSEFIQHYWKPAGTVINNTTNIIPNWNILGTGVDQCTIDPLSSSTCPGYTDAMCVTNPLYSTTCSGYATAYFTQQCTANPLYSVECPGYAAAYLSYQCSLDPLYSTTCAGYETAYFNKQCSLDPLYNNKCVGYEAAYFNQQCSLNPLYDSQCVGYGQAYFDQQCSINPLYDSNCTGYTKAYHDQQCSLNPLYATDCSGYAVAFKTQQCSLNALYATDCPGYAEAYKAQQCSINGLYDRTCPNYAQAYAANELLKPATTTTTVIAEPVTTPTTESSGEIKVAVVADQTVNDIIQTTATSASPAQAAATAVPLVATPAPAATVKAEVKQEEKSAPSSSVSQTSVAQSSASSDSKPAAPTVRQELQARREAAARAKAVEEGKNLANNVGKAASMEEQVKVQNVVIQAMGFTPGFDAYGKATVPDVAGYKPYSVYNNQKNIDNRKLGWGLFGPTDKVHTEMVDSQYNLRK